MPVTEVKATEWSTTADFLRAYLGELGGKNDGFHNSMMFEADPYLIEFDGEPVGFCSVTEGWNGGKMLTSFYITPENRSDSAEILDAIISELDITGALAASNDCHFIAVSFEKMKKLGTTFELQAYNCIFIKPKRPAEYGEDKVSEVPPEEYDTMSRLTEGQWDGCFGDPDYSFYAIRDNGETMGYGAIGRLPFEDGTAEIGIFTLPEYRLRGVGRSMVIHLAKIAADKGFSPVAGCWYKSGACIHTLASSGFILDNRIFYVKFVK